MMTETQLQPAIDKWRLWMCLTATAVVVGLLEYAAAGMFSDGSISRIDVSIIAGKTWFATMITTLPVVLLGPRGVMPTVAGYLLGTGMRMAICLVIAFMATQVMEVANMSVLVGMVGMYLALMTVELGIVGRYLWLKDELVAGSGEQMEIRA